MADIMKPEEISLSQKICTVPMIIPPSLKLLLSSVKNINVIDTADQVLEAMKDYIYKNDLYDKKNPRIIHCENDALKDVLGVPQFTLFEIKRIVLKMLLVENRAHVKDFISNLSRESLKRKVDDNSDDDSKRQCMEGSEGGSSQMKSNWDSSSSNLSSDEWSCFDDDDSLTHGNIFAVNQTYDIEYEVETDSSSIKSITDTDSDIEDLVRAAAVGELLQNNTDVEFWADRSSEECDDSDLEIPDSDKWSCKTCNSRNKPLIRYCLKCWDERIGWFDSKKERRIPPRSKARSLRKKGRKASNEEHDNVQSVGCSSSQETFCSSQSSSQEFGESSQENSSSTGVDMCMLCFKSPKNASVIHGNIAHQFSCYRCARKLLSLNKPCPICRKGIERVVHQFLL